MQLVEMTKEHFAIGLFNGKEKCLEYSWSI